MAESLRAGVRRLIQKVSLLLCPGEGGQSTTEYTLVILVAATIALLLLNWAKGGAITNFLDSMTYSKDPEVRLRLALQA